MSIKVSIIIPVYNTEDYLEQCLDSVVGQTLDGIEILAVDDGSTDGSLEILKRYEKEYPDLVKVFHKENGGLSDTRNYALQYAQGEYFGCVDSDDWVDLDMFEKMYTKAKEEQADIVICDMVDHFPTHEVYHHASQFEDKFSVTVSACNKIFRREFIGDIRFPVGYWYEDLEFTTKQLMKTDRISTVHEGFYHCHCRENSIMRNNNSQKNKDMLEILGHLEEYVKENGWEDKYADNLEYMHILHVLITTINRLEAQKSKDKRAVINELRTEVCRKYPKFYKDKVFKQFEKNQQIVAILNAKGLSPISRFIFYLKSKL